MEQNPYAAPKTRVADEEDLGPTELASRGVRFVNFLIDLAGYFALAIVLGVVLAIVYPPFVESESSTLGDYAFGFVVITSYYALSEGLFGRTLGKLVTGTWVVSESGGKPTFAQILGRSAARSIPFEPFSFFGSEPTGWHDRLSRTRVVRKARASPT
jgi:uncharacterized RDD family membrane protein YckC